MPVQLSSASAAMHGALVPIASLTGPASSFVFSNIPQRYQDLRIVFSGRSDFGSTLANFSLYVNGAQNNTSYSATILSGDGSTVSSSRTTSSFGMPGSIPGSSATAGVFATYTIDVLNYTSTSTLKTFLYRIASDFNGSGTTSLIAALYRTNTNAITQIEVAYQGTAITGSSATLYGIRTVGQ
jgi:hypothetical protein